MFVWKPGGWRKNIAAALYLVWTIFQEVDAPGYPKQGVEGFEKFIAYAAVMEKFINGEILFGDVSPIMILSA